MDVGIHTGKYVRYFGGKHIDTNRFWKMHERGLSSMPGYFDENRKTTFMCDNTTASCMLIQSLHYKENPVPYPG